MSNPAAKTSGKAPAGAKAPVAPPPPTSDSEDDAVVQPSGSGTSNTLVSSIAKIPDNLRFPVYNCDDSVRSAASWLLQVEGLIEQWHLDENNIMGSVGRSLEGPALSWFTLLADQGSHMVRQWTAFREAFKVRYIKDVTYANKSTATQRLQQGPRETVVAWLDRVTMAINMIFKDSRPPVPPTSGPGSTKGKVARDTYMTAEHIATKVWFIAGLRDLEIRCLCERKCNDATPVLELLRVAMEAETSISTDRKFTSRTYAAALAAPEGAPDHPADFSVHTAVPNATTTTFETAALGQRGSWRGGRGQQYRGRGFGPVGAGRGRGANRGSTQSAPRSSGTPLPLFIFMADGTKVFRCLKCNKFGHMRRDCPAKDVSALDVLVQDDVPN